MFYYRDILPVKGTIVVAQLILSEENENCLYVTLPEYNNSRGIVHKSELPKKVNKLKQTLSDMKNQNNGTIVCIISDTAKMDTTNNSLELIELSYNGVDKTYKPNIVARQRNLERIIKIVKFISVRFNLSFASLMHELQNNIVMPLIIDDISTIDDINDYTNEYSNFLRFPQKLLDEIKISEHLTEENHNQNILTTLKGMIKETNAQASLDFDIKIWKSNNNANIVQILREIFEFIKSKFDNIELRYIGAPTYQIILNKIEPDVIDQVYTNINQSLIEWLNNNNVVGYDLTFDTTQKKVKLGDVTINFPFKIDLTANSN